MSLPIVLRREARAEFDQAIDWYERRKAGLGIEFADRVQAALDRISATPEAQLVVYRDARKALVRQFPYSIIYRIRADRVVVLAVFHNKRSPKVWKARS